MEANNSSNSGEMPIPAGPFLEEELSSFHWPELLAQKVWIERLDFPE